MKIKKESPKIITPTKGHPTDAGYDIYSTEAFVLPPGAISARINLGVGFEVPKGYVGIISERSSQGKKGISTVGNIVDHGYTGNVHVTLINNSQESYIVNIGDRICQIYFSAILMEELEEVESFEATERGEGAHGSTGV